MNKKVLVLADGLGSPAGRGTDVIVDILKVVSRQGLKITLLTTKDRFTDTSNFEKWKFELKKYNITVESINLDLLSSWPHLSIWVSKPLTFIFALKLLLSNRFAVIHEYSSSPLLCLRTGILGALGRTKSMHTIVTANTSITSLPLVGVFSYLVTKIVFPSKVYAKRFEPYLAQKRLVILNQGVDVSVYKNNAKGKLTVEIPKNKKVILYLGPPEKTKGIFLAANAYKRLTKKFSNTYLLFVFYRKMSDTSYIDNINKLRNKLKGTLGWQVYEGLVDVPSLMSHVDAVVAPQVTAHGTLIYPQTVIEAMSCGATVIAPGSPELREIIEDGKNGYLFETGNQDSLVKSLTRFVKEKPSFKESARNTVVEQFNLEKNAKTLAKIYLSL